MRDTVAAAETLITLTTDIVVAHVSRNVVAIADLPALIGKVHAALASLGGTDAPPRQEPAVAIRASIKPDHIVCLEDGRKLKTLKRHLKLNYQMTPEQYRAKWGLPPDYPMVAPAYTAQRSALAKRIGLGTMRRQD